MQKGDNDKNLKAKNSRSVHTDNISCPLHFDLHYEFLNANQTPKRCSKSMGYFQVLKPLLSRSWKVKM
jgi:hypothetical protein